MREIKFRAVIPEHNATIYFDLSDLVHPARKDLFSKRELLIPWLLAGNKPDEYTGLRDNNGKEIYGGDIVEKWCHRSMLEPRNRGIENSSGYYKSLTTTVKWSEQGLNYNIYPHHDDAYWLVIGNIYENKELLSG